VHYTLAVAVPTPAVHYTLAVAVPTRLCTKHWLCTNHWRYYETLTVPTPAVHYQHLLWLSQHCPSQHWLSQHWLCTNHWLCTTHLLWLSQHRLCTPNTGCGCPNTGCFNIGCPNTGCALITRCPPTHRPPRYPVSGLLFADCRYLRLTGGGTVQGLGYDWWWANILHGRHRPHMLVTDRTTDLVINNLFLVDSPMCVLG
jgi:hypothetical protein